MKLLFLFISFLASSVFSADANTIKKYSYEDLLKYDQLIDADYSLDSKKIYYVANKGSYSKIWVYDIKTATENMFYDHGSPIANFKVSPNGLFFIFHVDSDNNKNEEIFSLRLSDKKVTNLSNRKKSRNLLCSFSKDGKMTSFISNFRDTTIFDIYKLELTTDGQIKSQPESIVQNNYTNNCGEFSNDNSKYVFTRSVSFANQEVMIKDFKKNSLALISDSSASSFSGTYLDKSDKKIFSMSNLKSEFKNIISLGTIDKNQVQNTFENWNVNQFIFNRDHDIIIFGINEDGYFKLKKTDSSFHKIENINLPSGIAKVLSLDKKAKKILISIETSNQPAELYNYELATQRLIQITHLNRLDIEKQNLPDAKLVKIKSEDGIEFSSWLIEPDAKIKNQIGLILVHVGPEEQILPNFAAYKQFLVLQGYTVIIPNFRGSTGYGTKFQKLVYGDWGGGHVKDLLAARNYLITNLGLSSKKISIVGAMFGGFAALSALIQKPDYFCAAADINGPLNLLSYINNAPENMKKPLFELIGDPVKDKEKLKEVSPFFNYKKIKTPLVVVQGKMDSRVEINETNKFVENIKSQNLKVNYIVIDNEGHGISKVENQAKVFSEISNTFYKYCE